MTASSRFLSAVLLAAFAPLALARDAPVAIKDPVAVPVTVKLTEAQLKKAVRASLLNRGWKLDHEIPGSLEATISRRDPHLAYSARISVSYDAQQVLVRYQSSEGLEYDATAKTILPDYNNWMDTLAKDLPVYMTLVTE
jgi:hypothetical protein